MNSKVYFSESEPGVFEKNKKNCLKNNFIPPTEYTAVNNFCWNVRDGINILFETDIKEKQNLSNQEKKSLNVLIKHRNVKICINDTDKNLGPISTDKSDVIKECQRQLYDIIAYNKISWEQAKQLIAKIKLDLKRIVNKHMIKGSCSKFEAKFLLSKKVRFLSHISILYGKY